MKHKYCGVLITKTNITYGNIGLSFSFFCYECKLISTTRNFLGQYEYTYQHKPHKSKISQEKNSGQSSDKLQCHLTTWRPWQ